jgi:N-acetylmuramoyl-L-alanine amidase
MNVTEKLLTINPYSRPGTKLQSQSHIVIHYVGNANTSALANRNYFESLKNKHIYASAQYIVGLVGEIVHCIPDDEVAYHAGNLTMNKNSIGIEVCHPTDEGYFNEATINALGELVRELVNKYGIKEENIIRHYDVTGKACPKYYVDNNRWAELKKKLLNGTTQSQTVTSIQSNVVTYRNGSTAEKVYSDSKLSNKIGSLSKYEECDCVGMANGKYIVRYSVGLTTNYKIGFVSYNGKVSSITENVKVYQNGSTSETVYCDSNLTTKIGSLDAREKCECIGTFNGKYMVKYKVNGTTNYKVGFVKYSGGVK